MENDNNKITICIKYFEKKEWAENFIKGKIYANTFQYFIDLENNTKARGQGDANEAQYVMPMIDLILKDPETGKDVLVFDKAKARIKSDDDLSNHVLCFSGFYLEEMECYEIENRKLYKFPKKFLDNMPKEFGEYCVVFTGNDLYESLYDNYLKNGVSFAYGPIKYCESNSLEKANAHFYRTIDRFFYKDNDLSNQNEFRCIFFTELNCSNEFEIDNFCYKKMHLTTRDEIKGLGFEIRRNDNE